MSHIVTVWQLICAWFIVYLPTILIIAVLLLIYFELRRQR